MPAASSRRLTLSEDIVPRLRARDDSAYKEVVDVCFTALARFAYRIVGSYDIAEDVVQEVIVKIAELGNEFKPQSPIVNYLYAAVYNRALNALRSSSREENRRQSAFESQLSSEHDGSDETFNQIEQYLSSLTERQRAAIRLRFVEQRTVVEVAGILGISRVAATTLLNRAIQAVRARYRG